MNGSSNSRLPSKIDNGAGARGCLGVEHVDPHMAAGRERPGRRQHDQAGVAVDHRFGQPDRAEVEGIARHNERELHQHDGKHQPGGGAADSGVEAVDTVGKCDEGSGNRHDTMMA